MALFTVSAIDIGTGRLDKARMGGIDAELGTRNKIVDLAEEARFDIDVVETYVPVTNQAKKVFGSVEIYMDVTHYRERLAEILSSSMTMIWLISVGDFGVLYLVMRRGAWHLNQYERIRHALATTDVLTGIANRRFLIDRADEEFSRVRCEKRGEKGIESAACILIDLGHFKKINDTCGHQVGDEVLRDVAERFGHCVRRYDAVGRYGGEEFSINTPNSDFNDIKEIAERVWEEVRARPFDVGDIQIDVTASVGFACIEEGDASVSDVIKRADDSLYRAKASGRDQIVWIPPGQPA